MSNILDKLGIYDLVGVLLTGICISIFSLFIFQIVYQHDFSFANITQTNETFSFLVASYFVGLIFQELGSICQRHIIYKNSQLLKKALKTSDTSHILLSSIEKDFIYTQIAKELQLDLSKDNDNIIYNYCKFYMINQGNTSKIDKEQSLGAMSRSLALYFLILTYVSIIIFAFTFNPSHLVVSVLSIFLSYLFYYRFKRFYLMRYVYIFRYYYYSNQISTIQK